MRRLGLLTFVAPLLGVLACRDATSPHGPAGSTGTQLVAGPRAHAVGGSWETKAPMPTARNYVATGVIAGKLYVATGSNTTALEVYDPASNSWTTRAPIPTNRALASADVIDGKLYVVGGCINSDCNSSPTNRLEMYDPATNSWTTKTSMPTARAAMTAGVIAGKLYVVGGFRFCSGSCPIINTLEVYDPVTNSWTTKAPMPTARAQMGGAVIDGKLYVIGGTTNGTAPGRLATLEVYDPSTNAWTTKASMPTSRLGLGAAEVNSVLYAVGGYNGAVLDIAEAYNAATDSWTTVAPSPTARSDAKPQGINGVLYVTGGSTSNATLEAFTPDAPVLPPLVIPSTTAQVSAGGYHTCALKMDGNVVCWGYWAQGQSTVPAGITSVAQVSGGGYRNCALKTDGTVVCWGDNGNAAAPAGLASVVQVSAGYYHNCALKTDRTVVCWGSNYYGETTIPSGLAPALQVSADLNHTCALKVDRTVVCWGDNSNGQATVPSGLVSVEQVSAGAFHNCALKTDGFVVCWGGYGNNYHGEATVPTGLASVTQVSAGGTHTCALKSDETMVCWGDNYYGQTTVPSGLASIAEVSAGFQHTCVRKTDGTVVCWGYGGLGQISVPAGLNLGSLSVAQSISFTSSAPIAALAGGTYTVAATGGASGNAVTFTSLTPAVCTVAGSTLSLIAVGTCTIAADQAAGTGYLAAPQVTQTFTVSGTQTISFISTPPSPARFGGSYSPVASGGASANAVAFTTNTTSVCTIASGVVAFVGTGSCMVAANQAAGGNYLAAPERTQTFTVSAATTNTTVSATPTSVEYNHTVSLSATVAPSTLLGSALSGTVQFKIDGLNAGAPQTLSVSGTATLVAFALTQSVGSHSLTAVFTSTNPNFGSSTSTGVTFSAVDLTPPVTTINSAVDGNGAAIASGGATLSASIAFAFTGTDAVGVVGFQCSLDAAPYVTCSSPATYSVLAVGPHTFGVRALDAAGNVALPASFAWSVVTPAQATQNLIGAIASMGLPASVANSLSAPLNNFNPNNLTAACGKLNAFINQINAKIQNGQLTASASGQLLQAANAIKAGLGCA